MDNNIEENDFVLRYENANFFNLLITHKTKDRAVLFDGYGKHKPVFNISDLKSSNLNIHISDGSNVYPFNSFVAELIYLSEFPHLTQLCIWMNNFDLSVLKNNKFQDLKKLDYYFSRDYNKNSEEILDYLPNLRCLDFGDVRSKSLVCCSKNHDNLKFLNIRTKVELTDLTKFPNLEALLYNDRKNLDVDKFYINENLKALQVRGCTKLENLGYLPKLKNLECLDLWAGKLTVLPFLGTKDNLKILSIQTNYIKDFEPLLEYNSIEYLIFNLPFKFKMDNLRCLTKMKNLKRISFYMLLPENIEILTNMFEDKFGPLMINESTHYIFRQSGIWEIDLKDPREYLN